MKLTVKCFYLVCCIPLAVISTPLVVLMARFKGVSFSELFFDYKELSKVMWRC